MTAERLATKVEAIDLVKGPNGIDLTETTGVAYLSTEPAYTLACLMQGFVVTYFNGVYIPFNKEVTGGLSISDFQWGYGLADNMGMLDGHKEFSKHQTTFLSTPDKMAITQRLKKRIPNETGLRDGKAASYVAIFDALGERITEEEIIILAQPSRERRDNITGNYELDHRNIDPNA